VEMEVLVKQQLYYSNKEWVPIGEIADSLLALESLIKSSPEIIEKIFPGVSVQRVDVYINELRSDSIWEDLVVKFIFGSQGNFDEQISNIRKKLGMEFLDRHPNVLGAIIGAMILGGGLAVYDSMNDDNGKRATIEANNNTIINIGAGEINFEADDLKAIIRGAIEANPSISENAIKVIKPARRDSNAKIIINQSDDLVITPESIKAIPLEKPEIETVEIIEDFESLYLEIRATDLDSTKRGWAAVATKLSKKRVRLQFDPTINPEELLERRTITGSATVVFDQKEGKKVPTLIFLRSVEEKGNK
jgi:hypothetical protein